jgi:hypothetical protein
MPVYFSTQSNLRKQEPVRLPAARRNGWLRTLSTVKWLRYFRANVARSRPIPWERSSGATADEIAAIAPSLQAWQLGESSDGGHLRAAARRYADQIGDSAYLAVVELFIREEQRHGAMLGQFLDRAGVGRVQANWGDSLFRAARYCITSMEAWTTPVVMVETLAVIYYNAIRRATRSAPLRVICTQILADELPHLRFQCERLAILFRQRSRLGMALTMFGHRLAFLMIVTLVWIGHRRALRAGGYGWRHYWRAAWDRMSAAWRRMDPKCYDWSMVEAHPAMRPEMVRLRHFGLVAAEIQA